MKYQQLDNLESGWKWKYLVKKAQAGENITHYTESSAVEDAVLRLQECANNPEAISAWIATNLNPALDIKLKQVVRATRKRYFDAEKMATRKKSIDLEYAVWKKLSERANELGMTLSATITHLLDESSTKKRYQSQVDEVRKDLVELLKK